MRPATATKVCVTMTIWRRSRKEETTSLLSRHQAYSTPQKKKRFSFRTPPMTPQHEEDDDKYEVDVVASEYDPSQMYRMSTLPKKPYPSTPIRKVEFKESAMPEPFRMPEPEPLVSVGATEAVNSQPVEDTSEEKPCTPSMVTQTLGFFDDICRVPRSIPKEPVDPPARNWGAAPSKDEDESTFPSAESTAEYSRSLMTPSADGTSDVLQSLEDTTDQAESFPEDEDHENFEVVLDSTLLSSTPQSHRKIWYSKGSNEEGKASRRSLVKRLFLGRKKKQQKDVEREMNNGGKHEFDEPQLMEEYEEPEVGEEDENIFDLPDLPEASSEKAPETQLSPQDPPGAVEELSQLHIPGYLSSIGHSRSAPPAYRSRSPVEDVFATLGSIFSSLDPLGQMVEEEKKDDYVAKHDIGPEDETEANINPIIPEKEPEKEFMDFESTPSESTPSEIEKKKRPLLVGLARKIRSFTAREGKDEQEPAPEQIQEELSKKKASTWKSTVDAATGRTFWSNRVTRASTFDPPQEALAEAKIVNAKSAEPNSASQTKELGNDSETKENDFQEQQVNPNAPSKDVVLKKPPKNKPLWKAVVDKKTGRTYYYHRKTRETTWTIPQELKCCEETTPSIPQEIKRSEEIPKDIEEQQVPLMEVEPAKEDPPKEVEAKKSEESRGFIVKGGLGFLGSSFEELEEKEALSDIRKEIQRLLNSLSPPDTRNIDKLMKEYSGREDMLMQQLREQVESQPFDEPIVEIISLPKSSPSYISSRTTTFMSKASATTKSSTITDKTERIRNTMVKTRIAPISENLSTSTSISSHRGDDVLLNLGSTPIRGGVVPRERELKVEELTESRVTAETFDKYGRVVRRQKKMQEEEGSYFGDNDVDMYGADSVSALSENDADILHRKDNFEQARRRALDDAIERGDWDLAAALSEGMRASNSTGDYTRAHTSWNQSDLDKFIAQNDWGAVKSYIARMRKAKKEGHNAVPLPNPGVDKRVGSRSQLQHKMFVSDSSWTSDSFDSEEDEESFDSEFS